MKKFLVTCVSVMILFVIGGLGYAFYMDYLDSFDGQGFINFCSDASPSEIYEKIRNGANVNAVYSDDSRSPILVWLAYHGSQTEVFDVLIRAGANVNATDNNARTALMWACFSSRSHNLISPLLNAGANINARDKWGKTALTYAMKGSGTTSFAADNRSTLINYLVQMGAIQ